MWVGAETFTDRVWGVLYLVMELLINVSTWYTLYLAMWFYILLSIAEGATELLPVSSTAHMLILYWLFNRTATSFDALLLVVIQALAVIGILARYYTMLRKNRALIRSIVITTMITSILILIAEDVFTKQFFDLPLQWLAVNLLVGGVLFWLAIPLREGKLKVPSLKHAAVIGVVQSLAFFPGVSRSGVVVLGMLLLGYRFKEALEYSFLTSIPILTLAAVYEAANFIKHNGVVGIGAQQVGILLGCGVIAAFIVYTLVSILPRMGRVMWLRLFGVYRILLGLILLFR